MGRRVLESRKTERRRWVSRHILGTDGGITVGDVFVVSDGQATGILLSACPVRDVSELLS